MFKEKDPPEVLDVVYDKVELNLRRGDHLFTQHVDDLDGEARRTLWGGEFAVAGDQVVLLLEDIGEGDIEYLPVVGRVDQHHIDHGAPIGDAGLKERMSISRRSTIVGGAFHQARVSLGFQSPQLRGAQEAQAVGFL